MEGIIFCRTPSEISKSVSNMTESWESTRTATDLRHTAAQRLVDAGATEEELAAFLGTWLGTGLIYFGASASQAERVNRALGISTIYQRVAKIAHDRFISPEELADLKGDQQIAGVPHGIPIAGIGGPCRAAKLPVQPHHVLLRLPQVHACYRTRSSRTSARGSA